MCFVYFLLNDLDSKVKFLQGNCWIHLWETDKLQNHELKMIDFLLSNPFHKKELGPLFFPKPKCQETPQKRFQYCWMIPLTEYSQW